MSQVLSEQDVRDAGGIVHRDGNVFFTNIDKLNAAILAKLADKDAERDKRIAELERELEAVRKDAERYRWLRLQDWYDSPVAVVANPKEAIKLGHDAPSREQLDALVDSHVADVQGFIDQTVSNVLVDESKEQA